MKFEETIQIKKSSEEIFDFTQNYGKRLTWDTFLKKAELINGATTAGKGVKAFCVARNGLGMETEYVSFNRPKVTAIKITKGPYLFKSFSGSSTFKEVNAGTTEVIFLYSLELRFPFSLFKAAIKRNLQKNVKQRLVDLKSCLEE